MHIMARSSWIRGPFFDGFFMLSGLWLAPVALYLGETEGNPESGLMDDIYLVLSALFWVGHGASSAYMAYCTTAYRPLLSTQRTRVVWVPLGICLAVFAFLVPEGAWPWPRADRLMALVIVDFLLVTYHFAAQHYGVLSLYRVRAGQPRTRAAKLVDRAFALVVGGALVIVVDALIGTESFQNVWLYTWASPDDLDAVWDRLPVAGTSVVSLGTMVLVAMELRTGRASLPRMLYLLSISVVVLTAFWVHPFVFVVLWTVQHWTAAMGLAVVVAQGNPDPGPSLWYRFWHRVNARPWRVLVFLMLASTALLPVMEVEAVDAGARYSQRLFPWVADALRTSPLVPALVALGFVTAFLHYQLDRAVFRLSDPEVREAAGAMLRS
ncbi:MAG: hypothetical protein DRJ42_21005 [Deltaproteobacteria bacterium]|nr:MAG: hypothetical protein DRJ42_21005 [Deltaproteobacteria bacterium]